MFVDDYIKARKQAKYGYKLAICERRSPHLSVLCEKCSNYKELKTEPLGCFEIPILLIAGTLTKGRKECFACNYMPLLSPYSEFAIKWQNLFLSQMEDGIRDEIVVYEYMGKFYVVEGNKRVSVLKYLKQPTILANVTRLLPKEDNTDEYKIYNEFLKFYNCTSFYGLFFTKTGGFEKLAELMGTDLNSRWSNEKIMDFKSAYINFGFLMRKKYYIKSIETLSDLFIEYITEYGINSLLKDGDDDIRKNFECIFKDKKLKKAKWQTLNQIDTEFNMIIKKIYSIVASDNTDRNE
jgi:hypothetical protein